MINKEDFVSKDKIIEFLFHIKDGFTKQEYRLMLYYSVRYWRYKDSKPKIANEYWNAIMQYVNKLKLVVIKNALKEIGIVNSEQKDKLS